MFPSRCAFGIDDQLDAAVALLAGGGGVGDDRVVLAMPDHKELRRPQFRAADQIIVDCHGSAGRQVMVVRPEMIAHRLIVGMSLDADRLVGILLGQGRSNRIEQGRGRAQ